MMTPEEMAALLPESDREAGAQLIARRVLPPAIAEAPDHPRIAELVQERVIERLKSTAVGERLDGLRALADEIEMEDLHRSALSLAIARFMHDGQPLSAAARSWITPEIARLAQQSLADIEQEAVLYGEILETWRNRTQAKHPRVWRSYRTLALHAGYTLASARTGSFETASGGLYEFLRDAGWPAEHFDVF